MDTLALDGEKEKAGKPDKAQVDQNKPKQTKTKQNKGLPEDSTELKATHLWWWW